MRHDQVRAGDLGCFHLLPEVRGVGGWRERREGGKGEGWCCRGAQRSWAVLKGGLALPQCLQGRMVQPVQERRLAALLVLALCW